MKFEWVLIAVVLYYAFIEYGKQQTQNTIIGIGSNLIGSVGSWIGSFFGGTDSEADVWYPVSPGICQDSNSSWDC